MSAVAAGLACFLLFQDAAKLFEKAPPAVDEALRARVSKFYEAHVEGKFRAAMEVVAEDSKDAFFSASKPRCYSFDIVEIRYAEDFTRATATVTCEMDHPSPGLSGVRVKAPRASLWKLADGQWWYYIDPSQGQQTPFGVMRPGPGETTVPPAVPTAPPPGASASLAALLSAVKASKKEVHFSSTKPGSDEVALVSDLPGTATLVLQYPPMPGLEISLDRTELKQGESARIEFKWEPKGHAPPPGLTAQILAKPTYQVISIRVIFGS